MNCWPQKKKKTVAIGDQWFQWLSSDTLSSIVGWLIWDSVDIVLHGGMVGRGWPLLKRD